MSYIDHDTSTVAGAADYKAAHGDTPEDQPSMAEVMEDFDTFAVARKYIDPAIVLSDFNRSPDNGDTLPF